MPIEGRLYTSAELQNILGVSKQRITNLSNEQDWLSPAPGLYYAEQVETYLMDYRKIDPITLPIRSWDFPDGATWAEQQATYDEVRAAMEAEAEDEEDF